MFTALQSRVPGIARVMSGTFQDRRLPFCDIRLIWLVAHNCHCQSQFIRFLGNDKDGGADTHGARLKADPVMANVIGFQMLLLHNQDISVVRLLLHRLYMISKVICMLQDTCMAVIVLKPTTLTAPIQVLFRSILHQMYMDLLQK